MGFFRELRKGRIGKFGNSMDTFMQRIGCYIHFYYFDHGWIRALYDNYCIVDQRLHRSSQPSYYTLKKAQKLGVTQVISFRNPGKISYQLLEERWVSELGLKLHSKQLSATEIATPETYVEIFDLIEKNDGKTLVHCKSGADRTGLFSGIYVTWSRSQTGLRSGDMLHWKFGHIGLGKKSINKVFLDVFKQTCDENEGSLNQLLSRAQSDLRSSLQVSLHDKQ